MNTKTHLSAKTIYLVLLATLCDASAASPTVVVPGTSDPWLAGMPDGSTASANDHAPAQSPVLVPGLSFTSGIALLFNPTGAVGNTPQSGDFPPEGNLPAITPHGAGVENGQDCVQSLDIAFDDKTDHEVSLPYIFLSAGESLGFRVFDKGNNEYDYGAFNFTVQQRDTRFSRFAPSTP